MTKMPDFDDLAAYRKLAELAAFVREIHDRFPEDELPVLYDRMLAAAVEVPGRAGSP